MSPPFAIIAATIGRQADRAVTNFRPFRYWIDPVQDLNRLFKKFAGSVFSSGLLWFVWHTQMGPLCQTSQPEKRSFRVDETPFFFEIRFLKDPAVGKIIKKH